MIKTLIDQCRCVLIMQHFDLSQLRNTRSPVLSNGLFWFWFDSLDFSGQTQERDQES
jgi:hypothetical protein